MVWKRGRAYAQDLRDRVFAAADTGLPVGQIAEMLFVLDFGAFAERQEPVAEFGLGTAFVPFLHSIIFDTADAIGFTRSDAPTRIEQWPSTFANPSAARRPCFLPT